VWHHLLVPSLFAVNLNADEREVVPVSERFTILSSDDRRWNCTPERPIHYIGVMSSLTPNIQLCNTKHPSHIESSINMTKIAATH
jgi:hypothetical protein